MFVLSYKIHDYDGGEFEPLFCSSDKSLIEVRQAELTEKYLGEQRNYWKAMEALRQKFPNINDSNRVEYAEAYKTIPPVSQYCLYDPEVKRGSQVPCGEFVVDEVEELQ